VGCETVTALSLHDTNRRYAYKQHSVNVAELYASICVSFCGGGTLGFPENLRQLRLDGFLSQAELARRAGLHALTVTRLEAGATAPSTRTVRALAAALGVEPRALATPNEVAELRRLKRAPEPADEV